MIYGPLHSYNDKLKETLKVSLNKKLNILIEYRMQI
jgi:hypothetical protein